jgi:diguanylate cyclase (GGDEF)-like protein/PAS domain S-box-containing protein
MPAAERLRLLESVVVNARDSILITEAEPIDLPGPRIVYCNPAFEQTTGYSDKDVRGKTPRILHGAGTSRRSLDILKAALRAWQPVEVELLNYRKDGSEFWVELSIVPVADERGWFTHWVSVQRDITERKALEAASIRAREDEAEKRQLYLSLAERQRAHDALVHAATHDALTGLPNRTHLVTRVDDTLRSLAQSDVRHSAVLYLDLDGFKLINDSLGHAAGDALLREVSCRLRECISTRDTLARISGDEFVILVQEVLSRDLLEELAQRINSRLRHSLSGEFSGFYLSCSIGIVPILKVHQDAEDVLRDGDAAMYAAKRLGNGKFMFFQTQMRDQAIDSIHLQKDLHSAIANEAFEVHYQPIFNAQTRSIVGMEALVRWTHSIRGAVPPDTFIPVAERIGIVGMIDQLVRTRSFQQFCEWRARMPALRLQLNVNVSALELRDSDFLKNLEQLAIYSGFSLTNLQIELTEGVLLNESHTTLTLLRQIRERGVRVAFDDFGTGYSSLAYIASYEIDTIKIDRSFVTKMLGNPRTMAVLESIVYLAKRLELDVVAEGVETEEQLSALALMGCDFVQGYLLGKPIPAAALTERLAHAHRLVELHTLATGNSIGD